MAKVASFEFEDNDFKPATAYKRIRKASDCTGSGILPLDMAISEIDDNGYAGIRDRDVVELVGLNNSHKTATLVSWIVETQRRYPNEYVAGIFSEAFDPDRLEQAGVDLDRLMIYLAYDEDTQEPNMLLAETACNSLLHVVRNPKVRMAFIDSVAAMTPKGLEFDGSKEREFGKSTVALLAKTMNEFIVKYKNHVAKAFLVLVNHYKEKIDTGFSMMPSEDKSRLETPGGRGCEFLSDVRILCKSNVILNKDPHSIINMRQGNYYEVTWTIFKNKYCPGVPHRTVKCNFDPKTGRFLDLEKLIDWGSFFTVKRGENDFVSKTSVPIVKAGAWVRIGDIKGNGTDKAVAELEKHPELVNKLKMEMYKLSDQFFDDKKPSLEELLEQ